MERASSMTGSLPAGEKDLRDRAETLRQIIQAAGDNAPPMARRAALETAARDLCGNEWEWLVMEKVGGGADIMIARFRGDYRG
ncbi:MAG: hypothetical protein ACRYG8_06680 [Janthinobacterium lividum]